ncbi:MAG: hypothetical protein LUF02_05455 [Erysipelotrichaceae bacterium]|nr:hypothetical protein [Erysipelotrichaceae bacterium]
MSKDLSQAIFHFCQIFRDYPNYSYEIGFNQIEYAKELDKCVEDHFDYTIEEYGTIPPVRTRKTNIIWN